MCKALLLAGCSTADDAVPASISVIPLPQSIRYPGGEFAIEGTLGLVVPDDPLVRENAEFFAAQIANTTGSHIVLVDDDERARIVLEAVDADGLSAEGRLDSSRADAEGAYTLEVSDTGIRISAATARGFWYGLATLWQLFPAADEAQRIAAVAIVDAPTFEWRGLMLDSARHMQSVAFIKRYIDWMSLHKLNVLHWHLTDDQAWRLQIEKYPRLTDIGAWRVPAGAASTADIDAGTRRARQYGGFYSQDEVREIVDYAALRHVTVVPEIDIPGHVTAALAAYPELGVDGHGVTAVPSSWGIFDNVLNLEAGTLAFLEDVFGEVAALFPGPYVHVGGDEVVPRQWQESDRIRERMAELGIGDVHRLQNYYVERLAPILARHGKTLIGWDEILEGDLPDEAVVMSWRGVDGAIAAAARAHRTVLSPAPTFYLDHLQTDAADAPPGRGGVVTVDDIYAFDPLPPSLEAQRGLVLGLQANLWTEHVRTEERAAYMTWPRAAAVAELGWSDDAARDPADFSRRLSAHLPRLSELGIPVDLTDPTDASQPEPPGTIHLEDRELELCSEAIVLALEDDAPVDGPRESYLVDIMDPCWIARDVRIGDEAVIEAAVGQLPFNFEIGELIEDVRVEPPETGSGELNVRLRDCEGPLLATLPLEPARGSETVTVLPPARLAFRGTKMPETVSLCLRFARHGVEPMWVLDWVRIGRAPAEARP